MSDLSSFFRSVVWPWVHSLANLKWHSSFSGSNLRVNLPLLQRAHLYTPGADCTNPPPPSALSNLPKSLLYIFQNIIEILFWPEGNLILTQYVLFWGARRLRNTVTHLCLSPSVSVFCFISFWSHHVWQIYISSMPALTILINLEGFDEVSARLAIELKLMWNDCVFFPPCTVPWIGSRRGHVWSDCFKKKN